MNSGPHGTWRAMELDRFARWPPMVAWCVWTSDGVYRSDRDAWHQVPDDVQVLMTYHQHPSGRVARIMWSGYDAYSVPGEDGEVLGRMIDNATLSAVGSAAGNDDWRGTVG